MRLFGLQLFGGPSNREIDAFAVALSKSLSDRVPPGSEPPSISGNKAARQFAKTLTKILEDAREFQKEHRLGVYGRARVANTFKWELKELGYNEEFVEEATKAVVLALN